MPDVSALAPAFQLVTCEHYLHISQMRMPCVTRSRFPTWKKTDGFKPKPLLRLVLSIEICASLNLRKATKAGTSQIITWKLAAGLFPESLRESYVRWSQYICMLKTICDFANWHREEKL